MLLQLNGRTVCFRAATFTSGTLQSIVMPSHHRRTPDVECRQGFRYENETDGGI